MELSVLKWPPVIDRLGTLLHGHLYTLANALDPVTPVSATQTLKHLKPEVAPAEPTRTRTKTNPHFALPLAFLLGLIVSDALESVAVSGQSPYLFAHRIYPPEFWPMSDVIVAVGFAMAVVQLAVQARRHHHTTTPLSAKYRLYLVSDQRPGVGQRRHSTTQRLFGWSARHQCWRPLNAVYAGQLLSARCRTNRTNRLFYGSTVLQTVAFYEFQLYSQWTGAVRDVFTAVAVLPFVIYVVYVVVYSMLTFGLTVQYLCLKQRHLCGQLHRLITITAATTTSGHRRSSHHRSSGSKCPATPTVQCSQVWHRFRTANRQLTGLVTELDGHRRHWAILLTVYFVGNVTGMCHIVYGSFFVATGGLFVRVFFTTYLVEMSAFLLTLTYRCTRVAHGNRALHAQQCCFLLRYQQCWGHRTHVTNVRRLLKIDYLHWNRRHVPKMGFRLINNMQINSNTFEIIFSYIITFFLMVFRRNRSIN